MRRNRKTWVLLGVIALLISGAVLWLSWPGGGTAARDCAKVPAGSIERAPELSCAGFRELPESAAFGWLKDAQVQRAEFWGDTTGRKVAISDFSDGAEGSDGSSRYVGVSLPTEPALWCSFNGRATTLGSLLDKAAAVQRAVAGGAATIDPSSGEVTSEREYSCFVESPPLD